MRSSVRLLAVLVGLALARSARADDDLIFPELPQSKPPYVEPGHWTLEPARPFMSVRADAGYLYLKPRVSFGYGKPFAYWGGFDVLPYVTPDAAGGYMGLRLQLDWFELRGGVRGVHSFEHEYLTQKPSYTIVDLQEYTDRPSNYIDFEFEAAASIPCGPGNIVALAGASYIELAPANPNVFDETLHVIVNPPAVYRQRLGYSLKLGREHVARVGVLGEVIELPDRNAQVVRAGFIGSFDIDDHFQLVATVLIPVATPDSIGLYGADYSELGIRYRWSTGHKEHAAPHPEIPGSAP